MRLNTWGWDIQVQRILDFEDDSILLKERTTWFSRVIKEILLPFLDDMASIGDIKEALKNEKYSNLVVTLEARKFLG